MYTNLVEGFFSRRTAVEIIDMDLGQVKKNVVFDFVVTIFGEQYFWLVLLFRVFRTLL